MQPPIVTEDDLTKFHNLHFPSAPLPPVFFATNDTAVSYEEDEGQDNLGYYPDGTPRTLTDEQIAMFRHSEIQALLRERRHAAEHEAGDQVLLSPRDENKSVAPGNTNMSAKIQHGYVTGQTNTSNKKKRKKRKKKGGQIEGEKSNADHHNSESGEERTYRRLARELDEQKDTTPLDLDY